MVNRQIGSRTLLMILSWFMLVLFTACSSSGGGGDGDDDGDGGQPLNEYDFTMRILDDDADAPPPLRFTATLGDEEVTVALLGTVSGRYVLDPASIILNQGPLVRIATDIWPAQQGILTVNLDTPLTSMDGDTPREGTVTVHVGSPGTLYTITITLSQAGVILRYNQGTPTKLIPWDEFEEFLGSVIAPAWQQQAALAFDVLEMLYFHVEFVVNAYLLIDEGGKTVTGDTLPAGVLPPGFSNPGTVTVTDRNGGEAQPGDSFDIAFDSYWEDDEGDTIDVLIDGAVALVNFWEASDEATDTLTMMGFHPYEGPGGVFFDNLSVYEVEQLGQAYVFDDTAVITMNGGYTILFTAPE